MSIQSRSLHSLLVSDMAHLKLELLFYSL